MQQMYQNIQVLLHNGADFTRWTIPNVQSIRGKSIVWIGDASKYGDDTHIHINKTGCIVTFNDLIMSDGGFYTIDVEQGG